MLGKPDFVFTSSRLAIFVDGCFWHGCPTCYRMPRDNRPYWRQKADRNRRRDHAVNRTLRGQGWTVVRIWEHVLRNPESVLRRLRRVLGA
jgi:DNA mismatch endonuclease, patch repair protein